MGAAQKKRPFLPHTIAEVIVVTCVVALLVIGWSRVKGPAAPIPPQEAALEPPGAQAAPADAFLAGTTAAAAATAPTPTAPAAASTLQQQAPPLPTSPGPALQPAAWPTPFPDVPAIAPDTCPTANVAEDAVIAAAQWCVADLQATATRVKGELAGNATSTDTLTLVAQLWGDILAQASPKDVPLLWHGPHGGGAPADWLEAGAGSGESSLLAAELARAAFLSPRCQQTQSRTIWVLGALPALSAQFEARGFSLQAQHNQSVRVALVEDVSLVNSSSIALLALRFAGGEPEPVLDALGAVFAPQVAAAAPVVLDGYRPSLEAQLANVLGFTPSLQSGDTAPSPAPVAPRWFLKPVTEPLYFKPLQRLMLQASHRAMRLSSGRRSFAGMGHSFECPMQAAFVRNAANYRGLRHVCEVGFNAGHGVINMLATNPNLTMTSFDMGALPWSEGMVEFVHQLFPGRFTYVRGNSHEVVPAYAAKVEVGTAPACDLFSVDGDHSYQGSKIDMHNAIRASRPNAYLFADDYTLNFRGVQRAYDELVAAGQVEDVICERARERYQNRNYQKGWCLGRIIKPGVPPPVKTVIHVATAQCGRAPLLLLELEMMVKTALMAADPLDHIHLHAILDPTATAALAPRLQKLADAVPGSFTLSLYPRYPDIVDLFKPCSTQSLSVYKLLPPELDCVIYLDRDSAALSSLEPFYGVACGLGDRLLGMAREGSRWVAARRIRGKHCPADGAVNGGILAENLKRLREVDFLTIVADAHQRYSKEGRPLSMGDQDILNGWFNEHPEQLQIMDGRFNTRGGTPGDCECCPGTACPRSSSGGTPEDATVLHGNAARFHVKCTVHNVLWRRALSLQARYRGELLLSLDGSNTNRDSYSNEYAALLAKA